MAWEGSWTLAGTPVAYQAETWGLVGKDSRLCGGGWAQECAPAAPLARPRHKHLGPLEPRDQGVRPLPPRPPASFAGRDRPLEELGPWLPQAEALASCLHALIVMGLGSLAGGWA